MSCRWVVLRIVVSAEGAKASHVLGPDIEAPDKERALELARARYTSRIGEIAVVSRLSWDLSMEDKAKLERRKKAHLGQLVRRRMDGSRKD